MSRRIFLSYAREDEKRVRTVYRVLMFAGFSPWMDRKDLEGGDEWEKQIERGIRRSGAFLSFVSPHTANPSRVLQKETFEAIRIETERLEGEGFLIPVRFDSVPLPPGLDKKQWVDWNKPGRWRRLLFAVARKTWPRPWLPALLAAAVVALSWLAWDRFGPNSAYHALAAARGNGRSLREPGPIALGYTVIPRGSPIRPGDLVNVEVVTDAAGAYLSVFQGHQCDECMDSALVREMSVVPGKPVRVFDLAFPAPSSLLPGYQGLVWTFVLSDRPSQDRPPSDPETRPVAQSSRSDRAELVFRSTKRPSSFRVLLPISSK